MAENVTENVKMRAKTIRVRTWTLTFAIIVTLVFYFLVSVTTKSQINPIDFVFLCIVQIVTHLLYFPDGELFGQKNSAFVSNKDSYNDKATKINQENKIGRLREYCLYEFAERKQRYIKNECGALEITLDELAILKQVSEKEIKALKSYEFVYNNPDGSTKKKIVVFSKEKRKRLYALLFKRLPVEQNYPETIMSAVENNGNHAIKDGSISYKKGAFARKVFQAIVIGGIFAYIGYTVRDGIGLPEIVQICMYLTTLISTAVLAFSSGENCSKIYKSRFYLELLNFIDAFNEWEKTQIPKIDVINEQKSIESANQ